MKETEMLSNSFFRKRKWGLMIIVWTVLSLLSTTSYAAKGDLDCDGKITLTDVIIGLKVTSDSAETGLCQKNDINGDNRVGTEEAIFGLHEIAGLNPVRTAVISGQVTGSGGLYDVKVSAGSVSTRTDINGYYVLENVEVPDNGRLLLTFDKSGYATYQRSLLAEPGKHYTVSGKLQVYAINEQSVDTTNVVTLDAYDVGTWILKTKLMLQADSLKDAAPGNVKVSVANGDPSTVDGRNAFPGDYLASSSATSIPDTPLISVAFAEITIVDSNGKEIKELTKPAEITIRLPEEFQKNGANAGMYVPGDSEKGTIEWWSYNETTGTWIREDADPDTEGIQNALVVEQDGILYAKGKVTHFTWWNADRPVNEHACLCVGVVDENNNPMSGVEVYARGVSYIGNSNSVLTNAQGKACVTVKRSTAAAERVKMIAKLGSAEFIYDVTSASEGNVETNDITTPAQEGSTLQNMGNCTTLMNSILIAFNGVIQGKVTYEGTNPPVPLRDCTVFTNMGITTKTNDTGDYTMKVPTNTEFLLFVPGLPGRKVIVKDPNTPVTENFLVPNRVPIIDSVSRNPEGKLEPGQQTTFTATARDEDGDPIEFRWAASAGTLGTPTRVNGTSSVVWTAPLGIGTALITVTVIDNRNGKNSESRTVVWGGSVQTNLKVTVKDTPITNKPVGDVYVILHGVDGKSVEQTIKTSSNDGIADFGNIGRNRATVTFAYIQAFSPSYSQRYLKTYWNIPVSDFVYYINKPVTEADCQGASQITVNLQWENDVVPEGVTNTNLIPMYGYTSDHKTFSNLTVCPQHIQPDGMISMLAQSWGGSYPDQKIIAYGFLMDQTITPNGTYTIPMNRQPLDVTFNTSPPTPLGFFDIKGFRKGREYNIGAGGMEHHHQQTTSPFGILQAMNEFPVDYYQVNATIGDWTRTRLNITKKYDMIAQYILIPVPDFSFGSATYSKTSKTFNWSTRGTMPKDWFNLNFGGSGTDNQWTTWDVFLNEATTSWEVVTLPQEISGWINPENLTNFMISTTEVDIYSGFDDMWNGLISGVDTNAQAGRMVKAEMGGTIDKARSVPPIPKSPREINDYLKTGHPLFNVNELIRY